MTGQKYLSSLFEILLRIQPTSKNIELFKEIENSFSNVEILNSFHQLKKSSRGDGLELEIMFFNEKFIHDIVFTSTTVDSITILTKSINMLYIETIYGEMFDLNGLKNKSDILKFTISYGGDMRSLEYQTDVKRFSEIHKIKNQMLNILIK
ncbi:hypothetical protein [Flavobacterium algoritolerans]|uniref:Uncharacterized protein n=1 Tax=Flavobacterium algoritolerans TaxID=3041254 RepID=A0ABT6V800_9FLAO|nr:hypothetical protein [Flavobacterium algoritolerans]MDI5894357.1 hypothetical protein [Flavobacterium algoritolerans]